MISRPVLVCPGMILALAGSSGALAQHGNSLDVESCYSKILVDKSVDWSHTQLRYAMMSLWNKDLYDAAQTSNSLSVVYAGAKVDDTYEHSNEERLRELYAHNESLDYDRQTASSRFFLDPQAGSILKECLDAKAHAGYGFNTVAYSDDYKSVTLELFWNWAPEGAPLRIHTTNIRNARVTDDDGTHPHHLLKVSDDKGWETFLGHDKLVSLERLDPTSDIIINIETNPDVRATHIVIPAVPKKKNCTPSLEAKDAFGQVYEKTITSPDMDDLPIATRSDDGHGHKTVPWKVDVATTFPDLGQDAIVTAVACRKRDPSILYSEIFPVGEPNGSTGTCHGWYQNRGVSEVMTITWAKKGYACTDVDWPVQAPVASTPAPPRKRPATPAIKPVV